MFDRIDHTTASCSRLTRSSLQLNQPVRRRSECTTTPVTSSVPSDPGRPSTRTYRKPWVVNRGSNASPPEPAATSLTWPSGSGSGTTGRLTSRCAVVRSPSRSSHSPYDSVTRPPAARARQPHPAAEVLPEVRHEGAPAAYRLDGYRPDLTDPPDRRRDRPDDGDVDVTRDGAAPRPVVERHIVHRVAAGRGGLPADRR